MQLHKKNTLTQKSILYVIIAIAIAFLSGPIRGYVLGVLFFMSAFMSYRFATANKEFKVPFYRNWGIAIIEVIFGIIFLALPLIDVSFLSVMAIFLILLAFLQVNLALGARATKRKTNPLLGLARIFFAIFSIIPAGLIISKYFDPKIDAYLLGIMFLMAAGMNYLFVRNASQLEISNEKLS